jgi:hypothetical protein
MTRRSFRSLLAADGRSARRWRIAECRADPARFAARVDQMGSAARRCAAREASGSRASSAR